MKAVNEKESWGKNIHDRELDEIQFLHNLGELYAQTNLPIKDIRREKANGSKYAVIVCDNDYEYKVDITADSWSAMITDVARFVRSKF